MRMSIRLLLITRLLCYGGAEDEIKHLAARRTQPSIAQILDQTSFLMMIMMMMMMMMIIMMMMMMMIRIRMLMNHRFIVMTDGNIVGKMPL